MNPNENTPSAPTAETGNNLTDAQALELQALALNKSETGIHIVDLHTRELYFCNEAGFRLLGLVPCALNGQPCYKLLHKRELPCRRCFLDEALNGTLEREVYVASLGRAFFVSGKISRWNGRDVYIEYITDISRDKRIRLSLLESEQCLETAAECSGLWYWIYDWKNDVARMSPRIRQDFQAPEVMPNFMGIALSSGAVDPPFSRALRLAFQRISQGGGREELDVHGTLPDGSRHWFRLVMAPLFDIAGKSTRAVCTSRIVDTEKSLAEKYELEKRRSRLGDENLIAHSVFDLTDGHVLESQAGFLSPDLPLPTSFEQVGRLVAGQIEDPMMRDRYRALHTVPALTALYESGKDEATLDFRRELNGRVRWVRQLMHLVPQPGGSSLLLFEYCYDINKNKTLDIMMKFAVADDYDVLGMVDLSDGSCILLFGPESYNPDGLDLAETDYEKYITRFAEHAALPEDRDAFLARASLAALRQTFAHSDTDEFFVRTRDPHGRVRTKKRRYVRYKAARNLFLYTQTDVTDLMLEEQRKQQVLKDALHNARDASLSKTTFLNQMSHEIRTPMNAIIGMTQLAGGVADNPEVQDYLKKIDQSSQYLLGIINDILDMSRIESGRFELHPQWTSAGDMLASCMYMLGDAMRRKNIQFTGPELGHDAGLEFYVDPLRTKQILMNLLNNAIKFTPDFGTITMNIRTEILEGDRRIDHVTITDSGCGMSQEFLGRIFTPFEQERNPYSGQVQGTGLGLALVKQIITAMGGNITVESRLGMGSTFRYDLPYRCRTAAPAPAGKAAGTASGPCSLAGRHILLVDDHPLNREIATKLLQKKGANVVQAVDGRQAVELFDASAPGHYNTILMDIRMPVMDGLAATKVIRGLNRPDARTVPIIAMTANAFDDDVRRSLDAGMNEHLAKPIDPKLLYAAIERHLAE